MLIHGRKETLDGYTDYASRPGETLDFTKADARRSITVLVRRGICLRAKRIGDGSQ